MKARSEAVPPGGGKVMSVELDDTDMQDVEGWADLPWQTRFRKMSDRADSLVVLWLMRRGDISKEFANQRLQEIKAGTPL